MSDNIGNDLHKDCSLVVRTSPKVKATAKSRWFDAPSTEHSRVPSAITCTVGTCCQREEVLLFKVTCSKCNQGMGTSGKHAISAGINCVGRHALLAVMPSDSATAQVCWQDTATVQGGKQGRAITCPSAVTAEHLCTAESGLHSSPWRLSMKLCSAVCSRAAVLHHSDAVPPSKLRFHSRSSQPCQAWSDAGQFKGLSYSPAILTCVLPPLT